MKYIAYYRVSTPKQGHSGLGLEAQRAAVQAYLKNEKVEAVVPGQNTPKSDHGNNAPDGGTAPFLEFVEVESGKRTKNRPRLGEAIQACRVYGAVLVIARLDRLSRNAHFLFGLQEAGIDFICADMPFANRLTIGVMALVAEEEARAGSVRTKAALAAAKARGTKLGGDRGAVITPEMVAIGNAVKKDRSDRKARDLAPIIAQIRAGSAVSLRAIAAGLNAKGVPTATGKGPWCARQVSRVLERL